MIERTTIYTLLDALNDTMVELFLANGETCLSQGILNPDLSADMVTWFKDAAELECRSSKWRINENTNLYKGPIKDRTDLITRHCKPPLIDPEGSRSGVPR